MRRGNRLPATVLVASRLLADLTALQILTDQVRRLRQAAHEGGKSSFSLAALGQERTRIGSV